MKWAIALSLMFLLLFGPLIVFLTERTRIRWLKPLAYFCIFLGPALAVLGVVQHFRVQKLRDEATESGGSSGTWYYRWGNSSWQKSPNEKPPQ